MTTTTTLNVAPGSVVVVRDEEWLVTGVETTTDGSLLRVQGLSELVRDTTASFYAALDDIAVLEPSKAVVVADGLKYYRSKCSTGRRARRSPRTSSQRPTEAGNTYMYESPLGFLDRDPPCARLMRSPSRLCKLTSDTSNHNGA